MKEDSWLLMFSFVALFSSRINSINDLSYRQIHVESKKCQLDSSEKKNVIVKRDIIRKKEPVNIIFCGHVDAGKSTIGGQLM